MSKYFTDIETAKEEKITLIKKENKQFKIAELVSVNTYNLSYVKNGQ